ncbi:MAG: hypothetical protein Edafosvirus3_89 [Edafosvirus sp.]|uniref:Transmembrane protein n=1 Tax=Edafosvirus sp. TaxID=2487765 RepID=A0A3G4ZVI4_9VIRU|nr:MAG: hypothetical protein Edafosvirus3_89 [Edafosvirus sp.]
MSSEINQAQLFDDNYYISPSLFAMIFILIICMIIFVVLMLSTNLFTCEHFDEPPTTCQINSDCKSSDLKCENNKCVTSSQSLSTWVIIFIVCMALLVCSVIIVGGYLIWTFTPKSSE